MPINICSRSTAWCFTDQGRVIPLPCGRWACPECSRTLAFQWAKRAKIGVDDRIAYFWTLTQPASVKLPKFAFRILPAQWDNLRKYCQRAFGKWSYFAVVEGQPHRGDMPHFHLLCFEEPPKRLKDIAVHCGFGYQAYVEPVVDKKAARYVSKYLTKQSPVTPAKFRRVRTSRDWPPLPPYEKSPYIVKSRLEHWLEFFIRAEQATGVDLQLLLDRWCDATGMEIGTLL